MLQVFCHLKRALSIVESYPNYLVVSREWVNLAILNAKHYECYEYLYCTDDILFLFPLTNVLMYICST